MDATKKSLNVKSPQLKNKAKSGPDSQLQTKGIENMAPDYVVIKSIKLGGLLGLFYSRTFYLS